MLREENEMMIAGKAGALALLLAGAGLTAIFKNSTGCDLSKPSQTTANVTTGPIVLESPLAEVIRCSNADPNVKWGDILESPLAKQRQRDVNVENEVTKIFKALSSEEQAIIARESVMRIKDHVELTPAGMQ